MKYFYLDSSAILKYVFAEKESTELRKVIRGELFSSEISRVEVVRRTLRMNSGLLEKAHEILDLITLLKTSSSTFSQAERLPTYISVRGLDAIHLASALSLNNPDLIFVAYDKELLKTAEKLGMGVLSPGAKL
jgi:predicted nucleic acid-binding protein